MYGFILMYILYGEFFLLKACWGRGIVTFGGGGERNVDLNLLTL